MVSAAGRSTEASGADADVLLQATGFMMVTSNAATTPSAGRPARWSWAAQHHMYSLKRMV
jgi:hypothetical protein